MNLDELQRLAERAESIESLVNAIDRFVSAQLSLKLHPTPQLESANWAKKAQVVEDAREALRAALEELK
jgi:DNA repair photolyase